MSRLRLLSRRLPGVHDPVSLFAALHAEGRARMLFRRTGGTSAILCDSALAIDAKGREAEVRVAGAQGMALLTPLLEPLAAAVVEQDGESARLVFAAPDETGDDAARAGRASPLHLLRAAAALAGGEDDPYALALFTLVGFDHADMVEPIGVAAPEGPLPDLLARLAETSVVVEPSGAARILAVAAVTGQREEDHRNLCLAQEKLGQLAARIEQAPVPALPDAPAGDPEVDIDDAAFEATVRALQDDIAAGEVFQAVPSRSFSLPCPDPLAAFRRLVAADPSAYQFFAQTRHGTLFGASPENAIHLAPGADGTTLSVSPIAGTRPRGATADEDDRLEADLRLDAKEVSEHLMLVDLARNDVARIARPGTRRVTSLMRVERFARVMHLVSTVEGRLPEGADVVDAIRACLNVGTLSGAPKLRAIELIRAHETCQRGFYGGAIGVLRSGGGFDSAVVIRSAFVADGLAQVRAGAGVVAHSDPAAEAAETRAKASAVLAALGAAA
ncbi:chorismate-binding protein [Sphingomicrobium astaxanthinifaciens]|uniref:chorismate-binding protein n=1 Tax=Sphingomicrobium astaxanthinifaciens TaxID=1227949 RepID=UPI001FCB7846|nr:chorismate-binding protein [Sphingomicrobium astaxanthinifaciens]MCJ7421203.1 chorismate-binding protein [Sphingomicrobium astaxanthinifaciens]